MQQEKEIIN